MNQQSCCGLCRHWMLGTLDYAVRMSALANNTTCTCHIKQPESTEAVDSCNSFDEAALINVPKEVDA